MDEIEAKILEIDRYKVEKKLKIMGAKKIFDGALSAIFFDFSGNPLASKGRIIRLRREGDRVMLAFKSIKTQKGVKVAEELETEVGNFDLCKKILLQLNLKEVVSVAKNRVSYKLGENRFDIDLLEGQLKGVPEYLEIEGPSKQSVYEAAMALGFSKNDCKPWTTSELAAHYGYSVGALI